MARTARKISSTGIYHVVIRGANRQLLFEENKDYNKYLHLLEFYQNELQFDIYAYCLMDNHVHLLINVCNNALDNIFRHINTAYAVWFNMKYKRTGFVQQNRFYSEPVDTLQYLYTAARYIHQNPQKAHLERFPADTYPWSSIYDYKYKLSSFVNTKFLSELMGGYDKFLAFQANESTDSCFDIEKITKRTPDDVAKDIIKELSGCENATEFQNLSILTKNKFIKLFYANGLSIRQINRLTGISKKSIERAIKAK